MNNYYVYVYLDQRRPIELSYENFTFQYEPFYIGKGRNDRDANHLKPSSLKKNSYKNNKIKKIILELQEQPLHYRLVENLSEEDALSLENKLICLIGRCDLGTGPLTNLTDGGEVGGRRIASIELREKRRIYRTGKKHSEETRRKLSVSNSGKKQSKEQIEKKVINVRKPLSTYDKNGVLKDKYISFAQACELSGVAGATIWNSLKTGNIVKKLGLVFKYD